MAEGRRAWFVMGAAVVLLLLSWISVRAWLFGVYRVPSAAMAPTIRMFSHVWVNKLANEPVRGDVIVLHHPGHPDMDFIKRVVGVPGDEVVFDDGHLVLNGKPVPHCKLGHYEFDDGSDPRKGELFVEFIDEHAALIFIDSSFPPAGRQGPYHVGPGELFVAGDNRLNSADSRVWKSAATLDLVVGKVTGVKTPSLPRGTPKALSDALARCLVGHHGN